MFLSRGRVPPNSLHRRGLLKVTKQESMLCVCDIYRHFGWKCGDPTLPHPTSPNKTDELAVVVVVACCCWCCHCGSGSDRGGGGGRSRRGTPQRHQRPDSKAHTAMDILQRPPATAPGGSLQAADRHAHLAVPIGSWRSRSASETECRTRFTALRGQPSMLASISVATSTGVPTWPA